MRGREIDVEKIIIVGISTNARHAYEFVKDYNLFDVIGFAVDEQYLNIDSFYGLPVFGLKSLDQHVDKANTKLFLAMLWNHLNADRRKLFERLAGEGWQFANLVSPSAKIRGKIVGSNVWVHDNVVIQNDAIIGDNVSIMAMALIGSDTVIEDHCFFGTKSTIGGGSKIGEQSFVGMNCTVFDGTEVGKKCILGACAAIKRNIPDYSLCRTNIEYQIKQYDKDEIENKLIASNNVR